jgi:hypothetical protein
MRTSQGLVLVFLVVVGSCTFDPEKLSTPGIRLTDGGIDFARDEQPGGYDSGGGDSPMLKPDTSVVTLDGQGPRETNGPESTGTVIDVGSDKASPTLDLPSSSDTQQALPDVPMVADVGPAECLSAMLWSATCQVMRPGLMARPQRRTPQASLVSAWHARRPVSASVAFVWMASAARRLARACARPAT